MSIENTITQYAEELLPTSAYFVVGVTVSQGRRQKVQVVLDGDEGIGVDICAKLSRGLGARLEEEELFADAYVLEVSSPGVDQPLRLPRQYPKHVGRRLKLTLHASPDGGGEEGATILEGTLTAVHENGITLDTRKGGKPGKAGEAGSLRDLPFGDIKTTHVLVSFK